MRLIYIVIMILVSFNVKEDEPIPLIKSLTIKYVDFDIETPMRINCEDFEYKFKSSIHNVQVTDTLLLKTFFNIKKELKLDTTNYFADVRAKILIHYVNNTTDTLCVGSLGIIYNDRAMYQSNDMIKFIIQLNDN